MLDKDNIPQHVAIIMDGNGRWARQRGLSRSAGHRVGIKRIKEIVKSASELGIKIITIFAFSTENWQRPRREVNMLMRAFFNFLNNEIGELHKNNIRFQTIGRDKPLQPEIIRRIREAEKLTAKRTPA
jgi:undecaprenyl diphosphate synthase